ncbi:class A beta-lactamase [Kitasatospora viridis]|uniref:Beta-lactamase n=1 Tax=Kitasatospora viridis TaxID=281105 RepID=A0A561SEL7_9ACTN|nr:class A beta-lactamase [Kitasatospora viridis]TWF73290.1 beta-lactamase class A [Kitasatospora viridis]
MSSRPLLAVAAALLAATALSGCAGRTGPSAPPAGGTAGAPAPAPSADAAFQQLEQHYGARLGVYVLDTGSGRELRYRADERFAFASTAKTLSAGALLRTASEAELDKVVRYSQQDLLAWAPVTSQHLATGMTVRDLLAAALDHSDNTAANLVTAELGGPAAVQQTVRALGDTTTNVDRTEPTLNEATPGDPRDTSTPRQLATDLRTYALGDALPADRRTQFTDWLVANTTGGPYIRAGVPAGWKVGDKTGNGDYGTRNDIAVVWPAGGRAPLVVALLSDRGKADAKSDDDLLAQATKTALSALG